MGYTYKPAYYSSLQDSITSFCKSILPFSLKNNPRLPHSEHKLSKQQSDNLKWQQNSFHQILNLIGLHKEGMVPDAEVSGFRTHLLDTLIASKGPLHESPSILRDKLLFLQELLYAKCISDEEYHASKRPLLQRLAVQGAELDARDVIIGEQKQAENSEEEWSEIDLRDEQSLIKKEPKNKISAVKQIKEAASSFGLNSLQKLKKPREQKCIFDLPASHSNKNEQTEENPFWDDSQKENEIETKSILMSENLSSDSELGFRGTAEVKDTKSAKKRWGFDGLKRWKKSHVENGTGPLPLSERSKGEEHMQGSDSKQVKKRVLADGSFSDKVDGYKIKKELTRIQTELSSANLRISSGHGHGGHCDVVKKEFKDHNGEMQTTHIATSHRKNASPNTWTTFEDDENCHPNRVPTANFKSIV